MRLSKEIIEVIEKTLDKGNTVEVRKRKDDIVVYETTKKTIQTFPIKV